jgi:hypothetical protein
MLALLPVSCSISYKFDSGTINYDLTKTIRIEQFPNRTSAYPEMSQIFDLALRKRFIEQTRLKEVENNADIEITGEITGFDVTGMAVKEDAYSSMTSLTVTVRVHYVNNREEGKDIDQSFSSSKEFDSSQSLDSVQDELVKSIVKELVDKIYNSTFGNW